MSELKVNIEAKLQEIDEDLNKKIIAFTSALAALPHNLNVYIKIFVDEKESDSSLQINLGSLLTEQVKQHFNKKSVDDLVKQINGKLRTKGLGF